MRATSDRLHTRRCKPKASAPRGLAYGLSLAIGVLLMCLAPSVASAACGAAGKKACTVFKRPTAPGCNRGLIERGGRCYACGANGQFACPVTVRVPSCNRGLAEAGGRCTNCGAKGEIACPVTVQNKPCDSGLINKGGRCRASKCGNEGKRPCRLHERVPSCDKGLAEDFAKNRCVKAHTPRLPMEPCSPGHGCTKGYTCVPAVQKCMALKLDLKSIDPCGSLKIPLLSKGAREARTTMAYSGGGNAGVGIAESIESGTVYGEGGQFGCFVTVCGGVQTDVSVAGYGAFGMYTRWKEFAGASFLTSQSASVPLVEAGFTTGQVMSTQGKLIGSVNAVSIGAGLLPVQAGGMACCTAVLQPGQSINALEGSINTCKTQLEGTVKALGKKLAPKKNRRRTKARRASGRRTLASLQSSSGCRFYPIGWQRSIVQGKQSVRSCVARCTTKQTFGAGCSRPVCRDMCKSRWSASDLRADDRKARRGLPNYNHGAFRR